MYQPMFLLAAKGWVGFAVLAGIITVIMLVLYFVGKKMQKKQEDAQAQIDASKQTVSMLIIDKKKMKPADSGLPEAALSQIPWYAKRAKLPIVKAKIGPQIMSLMCDQAVYDIIPVKKECKVGLSGIYVIELKAVRGGKIPDPPKKVGFFKRIFGKKNK